MTQPPAPSEFAPFLERLDRLTREHLLFYRLEVGRLALEEFFGGDLAAYLSRDPRKPHRFGELLATCGKQLAEMDLQEQTLRNCILARGVVDALPDELRSRLRFSHLVELSRVGDLATRRLLAQATVDNQWSVDNLKGAAQAARLGRWIDAAPAEPGLQAPEPVPEPEPEPDTRPGHVVNRFERAVKDLDDLAASWEKVAGKEIRDDQRARLKAAVAALKGRVQVLEGALDR